MGVLVHKNISQLSNGQLEVLSAVSELIDHILCLSLTPNLVCHVVVGSELHVLIANVLGSK